MSWLWKQSVSVLQLGPWWVSGRGGWARGAITKPSGMHEFPDQHGGHDDCGQLKVFKYCILAGMLWRSWLAHTEPAQSPPRARPEPAQSPPQSPPQSPL